MEDKKPVTPILTAEERARTGKHAGIVGIVANLFLFAIKLVAGILAGSIAVIADAVNNLTDAGSSILVMLGYVISAKPADKEHPYGHARMEYLCSLFISVIVTILGIELIKSSLESLFSPGEGAHYSILSIAVMAASVAVKLLLAVYFRRTGKRIDSESLRATAMDCMGDVCATCAVILGILLTPVVGNKADGIFGGLIAVYILLMGIKLIKDSSDTLLGQAPDKELVKKIVLKLKSYDGVLGIHDLVVHNYGVDRFFASVHLEMDARHDIMESHDIIDNIEVDFKEQMGISLVIHLDPVTTDDERVNTLKLRTMELTEGIASEFSAPISLHDFRVVFGLTHTNIIFDLAISTEFPLSNEELVRMLREDAAEKIGKEYNLVITVDRDYVTTRY